MTFLHATESLAECSRLPSGQIYFSILMYKFDLFEASAPVDDSRGKINSTKKISFDSSFVTNPNILEYSIRIQVGYALCNITDDSGTDLILKLLHVFQVFAVKHFMVKLV